MFSRAFEHTTEENPGWRFLRAVGWEEWPVFVAQPVIPPLLFFVAPVGVFPGAIAVGWLWTLVRYRAVDPDLAYLGAAFVAFLKWPSALVCAALRARAKSGQQPLAANSSSAVLNSIPKSTNPFGTYSSGEFFPIPEQ